MVIRQIEPQDYGAVMELISEFAEESLWEYGVFLDELKLKETFRAMYETSFVLVVNTVIEGVFGGRIIQDLCSDHKVYEEVIWYVRKENRKYGVKLFQFVIDWCYSNNIQQMTICCMHNSKTEICFRLYERLGFRPMETRFIKELE